MKRGRLALVGLAAVFVGILLYTTLRSAPPAPEGAAGVAAERLCEGAVRERVPSARFPIAANARDLGDRRYLLDGVVDSGPDDATVRQNYECLIRRDQAGAYVTDSVRVWQSH